MADPSGGRNATSRRYVVGFDTASMAHSRSDVLVIGSGIAGLTAALHASGDRSVTLVTKGHLADTTTWYAQGGIAGAVGEADSVELHVADTLVVGQGLCDEAVVRAVIGEAPEALESLQGFGVRFDLAEEGGIALAREGGHSLPRVLHTGDKTGATIQRALTEALLTRARIPVLEHRFLVDLLTRDAMCIGALLMDSTTGVLEAHFADAVVLATGGAGQVFRVTTNPAVATGDGVAAAWRAGAEIMDMEFVQFHPTALDHESAPRFLVSEALRGEGAYLLDCDMQRFMVDRHPLAELAPRDVVSREIERVMLRCDRDNVWLDARHLGESRLRARFPTIWSACAVAGYDLAHDLLPVAPAAHYLVGGVRVDIDGRTTIPGLFASGEVAASGLHGANRLASNSLLEGLVFSRRIVRALPPRRDRAAVPHVAAQVRVAGGRSEAADSVESLHAVTSRYLGMSRAAEGLEAAIGAIGSLEAISDAGTTVADIETRNLFAVADLIARSALMREESRGCHSRSDFPQRDDGRWCGRVVTARNGGARYEPGAGPSGTFGVGGIEVNHSRAPRAVVSNDTATRKS